MDRHALVLALLLAMMFVLSSAPSAAAQPSPMLGAAPTPRGPVLARLAVPLRACTPIVCGEIRDPAVWPTLTREIAARVAQPAAGASPSFAGWGWGAGIQWTDSLTVDLVDAADVTVDQRGVLHVAGYKNVAAEIVAETHVTFQIKRWLAGGPFVSITPGTDGQLVRAAGLGFLFELNRPTFNRQTGQWETAPVSLNLGVGINVIFDAVMLRDGFIDGFSVPTSGGDPTITRERAVLQIMSTIGFPSPF